VRAAPSKKGTAKAAPAKNGTAKAAPAKKGTAKAAPAKNGTAKAAPAKNGTAKAGTVKRPAEPKVEEATRAANGSTELAAPAARASDGGLGKYVYCVIHADKRLAFGPLGIGAEPSEVHTVNYKDIAAVVSDTPIEVHEPTRQNALAHERVNERVMRDHTVIPMSFGTVFKTRDDIHELLRSAYDAFKDVLIKMQDKLEFGLKVLWDRDVILRELEHDDEDIRRLKGEISSQKGSTYFARMQYGRLVDAALQARSDTYVAEIFDYLRTVSVASRANKPIGDRMILNAAFLVSRDRESAFDARVKEIGARFDKLTFKYTGPWPPYNFVNIRLKLEKADGSPAEARR
jgi:hypothetical protein